MTNDECLRLGTNDMAGNAAKAAVEQRGSDRDAMTKFQAGDGDEESFWLGDESDRLFGRNLIRNCLRFGRANCTFRRGSNRFFAKTIPQGPTTSRIISQLVGCWNKCRSGTTSSRRFGVGSYFEMTLGPARREARERSIFCAWLVQGVPELKTEARKLWLGSKGNCTPHFCQIWRSSPRRNDETRRATHDGSVFVIRHSDFLRHSSFVIRHSLPSSLEARRSSFCW